MGTDLQSYKTRSSGDLLLSRLNTTEQLKIVKVVIFILCIFCYKK